MRVRYTLPADKDIFNLLSNSIRLFGPKQAERYLAIIRAGIQALVDEPDRPASKRRHEIGPGVRSFHLQLAARRQGGASHVIFYLARPDELVILRVLPDAMDPTRRVISALRSEKRKPD